MGQYDGISETTVARIKAYWTTCKKTGRRRVTIFKDGWALKSFDTVAEAREFAVKMAYDITARDEDDYWWSK